MSPQTLTPKEVVVSLMRGAVPERVDDIDSLWDEYHPDVELVEDSGSITLNACKDSIQFDLKTMEVFWLIGLGGWRAIECYSPHVVISATTGQTLSDLLINDEQLGDIERAYKERRAVAQTLIEADDARHNDLREEELACDVWAREFMIAKLENYADRHGHEYQQVLCKRSMGLVLAALILHVITPFWAHGGNEAYFSVGDRLRTILDNTPLPDDDHFWIFASSVLVGIFQQENLPIIAPSMAPKELAKHLLSEL